MGGAYARSPISYWWSDVRFNHLWLFLYNHCAENINQPCSFKRQSETIHSLMQPKLRVFVITEGLNKNKHQIRWGTGYIVHLHYNT